MASPTHKQLSKMLKDLHRWVLDHPDAFVESTDIPEEKLMGFTATRGEDRYQVYIHVSGLRSASCVAGLTSSFVDRIRQLIVSKEGRQTLASILSCSNGWNELGGYGP